MSGTDPCAFRAHATDLVMRDLLDAIVQEELFDLAERAVVDPAAAIAGHDLADGEHWCRIDLTDGRLTLRITRSPALQPWRLARGPVWHRSDDGPVRELTPAELVELLITGSGADFAGTATVLGDLTAAVEHAAVTLAARATPGGPRPGGLLAGERLAAARGRPFHPTARAISGWTGAEVARFGPCSEQPIALDWVAVRRDRLRHGADPAAHSLPDLLLDPADARTLTDLLQATGFDGGFEAIPVHPWQFDHVLPREFAAEFAAGDIVPLARGVGRFHATTAVRTLATAPESGRHLKLPLGVATLGATRLLPPRYLDNGDRAHRLMTGILARDSALRGLVGLADESTWAGWSQPGGTDEFADRPAHLAAQLRRFPPEVTDPDAVVLPMGALAAPDWDTLAAGLGFGPADGTSARRRCALDWFGRIADAFCRMGLGFLSSGVLPEVHGQNVLLVVRRDAPVRFILRDHDTLRVFPPWLAAAGLPDPDYRIAPGARQSLRLASGAELVGYLQTLGFQVNLFGITHALAAWSTVDESQFWARLRTSVVHALDAVAPPAPVTEVVERVLLRAPNWPSRHVLGPLLHQGNSAGVSMPAGVGTVPNPLLARGIAEHATTRRLLNSYLRETGNHDPRATADSPRFAVRLPAADRVLEGEVAHWSAIGLHVYGERFTLRGRAGDAPRPLDQGEVVAALLTEVAALVHPPRLDAPNLNSPAAEPASSARVRAMAAQIDGSVAHSTRYQAHAAQRWPQANPVQRSRIAEQSVLLGHPLHPTPKSADGFTAEDVAAFAPELGAEFRLHYLAVAPELLIHQRVAPGEWLTAEVRAAAAGRLRGTQSGHVPIPVHPWQARHLLRSDAFHSLVAAGALVPLGPLGRPVYATSSVRTVCDPAFPTVWKLPLHVRITNFVRNNPREHLRRATDASALLAACRTGPGWPAGFEVLIETGSHLVEHPELAAELSVLYRENPFTEDTAAAPQVLAGLLDESPHRGEPGLVSAVRTALDTAEGALPLDGVTTWLRRYLAISLRPLLSLFARDGISLEAHVQNSLVCLDNGWPTRFVVRDMEGVSVSAERATRDIAEDSPVRYSDAEAWHRLQYYVITNHLGHLLHVLGHGAGLDERVLWGVVADELRTGPGHPYAARLLASPTLPAKANLLSRFAERGERPVHVRVPNPIREDHR